MRIALTHNLRLTDNVEEAEFDNPETIDAIVSALKADGHDVDRLDVTGPASRLVARLEAFSPDLIFNTAEGKRGRVRRAFYPLLFEELGFPFTGSDAYALAVTLDKNLTKKLLLAHGVPTPLGRLMTLKSLDAGALDDLVYPVICKPNYEGSSKGIGPNAVAEDPVQLAKLVEELAPIYDDLLVERYVPGIDVVVGFLEGAPDGGILEPGEQVIDAAYPRRYDVFDFELKQHHPELVSTRFPASLPSGHLERVKHLAARVVSALDLRDAATLDFRVARDGEIFFLSATALPTLQPDGNLACAAAHAGISYELLIQRLVRNAAVRAGLDTSKAKSASRRRPGLRVGLAFNLKRTDTELDDTEAEYGEQIDVRLTGEGGDRKGHDHKEQAGH
jgi:D-alanine--D-alanine ligase